MDINQYKLAKRRLALAGYKEKSKTERESKKYEYQMAKLEDKRKRDLAKKREKFKEQFKKIKLKGDLMAKRMISQRKIRFRKLLKENSEAREILRSRGIFKR